MLALALVALVYLIEVTTETKNLQPASKDGWDLEVGNQLWKQPTFAG